MEALIDACKRSGAAIELNSHPARLDLNEENLALAKEKGVLVSIAADAHSVRALAHIEYGVTIARRAGLGPDDVLRAALPSHMRHPRALTALLERAIRRFPERRQRAQLARALVQHGHCDAGFTGQFRVVGRIT